MSSRITHLRKGAKNKAKAELFSPPCETKKQKTRTGPYRGGNSKNIAYGPII